MTPDQTKALGILAGCPCGATEGAMQQNGIAPAVLEALLALDWVSGRVETHATPKGYKVRRFHITAAGRLQLELQRSKRQK